MRLTAILISVVVLLMTSVLSVTCTQQDAIDAVAPVSVRVRSVPPKIIPRRTSTSGGGRGGRYSSSSSGGK